MVPRQVVRAAGTTRIERAAEGYVFTIADSGDAIVFDINSGVASQIVGVCQALAILPLFDLGCERLEKALSVAGGPLSGSGKPVPATGRVVDRERTRFLRSTHRLIRETHLGCRVEEVDGVASASKVSG